MRQKLKEDTCHFKPSHWRKRPWVFPLVLLNAVIVVRNMLRRMKSLWNQSMLYCPEWICHIISTPEPFPSGSFQSLPPPHKWWLLWTVDYFLPSCLAHPQLFGRNPEGKSAMCLKFPKSIKSSLGFVLLYSKNTSCNSLVF